MASVTAPVQGTAAVFVGRGGAGGDRRAPTAMQADETRLGYLAARLRLRSLQQEGCGGLPVGLNILIRWLLRMPLPSLARPRLRPFERRLTPCRRRGCGAGLQILVSINSGEASTGLPWGWWPLPIQVSGKPAGRCSSM